MTRFSKQMEPTQRIEQNNVVKLIHKALKLDELMRIWKTLINATGIPTL